MRITRQEKDQSPEIYGYGSVEQLMDDPARFGDDLDNQLTNWVPFRDGDGDLRFTPCTKEYFHFHRNENRNEQRRNQTYAKRCPVSTDSLLENSNFEFADSTYQEELEKQKVKDNVDYIWSFIHEFNEVDQQILKLYIKGHTDAYIAAVVNKGRITVQDRRVKCAKLLKEKIN